MSDQQLSLRRKRCKSMPDVLRNQILCMALCFHFIPVDDICGSVFTKYCDFLNHTSSAFNNYLIHNWHLAFIW